MAIPSGAGTEVLKRATKNTLNNGWFEIIGGSANHIYTILSIVFCDQANSSGTIGIAINDGSNDIQIVSGQSHAAQATFVFNDKLVLYEDDTLDVYNTTTNGDWYVSYIDQHF